MLSTPQTDHISHDAPIYPASEDSYFFVDVLSSPNQINYLTQRFHPTSTPLILEVGVGSGILLSFVAVHARSLFGREDVLTLGTDVNTLACSSAAETVRRNLSGDDGRGGGSGLSMGCVTGSMASMLRPGAVDVLLCNPPYVPSEELPSVPVASSVFTHAGSDELANENNCKIDGSGLSTFELHNALLALATDGGEDGMQMTWALLKQLDQVLHSTRGVAYVLVCARNKPLQIIEIIHNWKQGWTVESVGSSGGKGGWERLQILRIARA